MSDEQSSSVSALPEDDGKLIERLRDKSLYIALAPATRTLCGQAATRIETLSREIERRDDALRSIREHVEPQPSALAKAIKATCDSVLTTGSVAGQD